MKKDIVYIGIVVFLVILLLSKSNCHSNSIDTSQLKKDIISKLDSINHRDTFIIKPQKLDIITLTNKLNKINSQLNLIDEKLKEDTTSANNYTDSSLQQFLLSR